MSPRPILKRSPTPNHRAPHAVHFPPSPSLTTHTFAVYSAAVYDRSPIVVAPNNCALPERGCPGRTYALEEEGPSIPNVPKRHPLDGRERHPRAIMFQDNTQRRFYTPLPALIPDLSSESDESDSSLHTPLVSSAAHHIHGLAIPPAKHQVLDYPLYAHGSLELSPSALSFLPHPPSSPTRTSYDYATPSCHDTPLAKPKRRRERKNDSSRSPDRIPIEAGNLPAIATPTNMESRGTRITAFSKSVSGTQSNFRVEEDSCLGGF